MKKLLITMAVGGGLFIVGILISTIFKTTAGYTIGTIGGLIVVVAIVIIVIRALKNFFGGGSSNPLAMKAAQDRANGIRNCFTCMDISLSNLKCKNSGITKEREDCCENWK